MQPSGEPTSAPGEAAPKRGRQGRRAKREAGAGTAQVPFTQLRRPFDATKAVSVDELESIHEAALVVLRDVGIDVLDEEARGIYERAGASVDAERVRLDPAMVTEVITTCPSEFTLHAPNPAKNVRIGGDNVVFTAVGSAPFVSDAKNGRREGNREDFRNLVKLSQHFNAIHIHGGYPVEPSDLHASVRHLHATKDLLTLSDKVINVYSLGRQRNRDCLEMVRIARQVTDDQLDVEPSVHTVINSSSPLRLDKPMLGGILEYAKRGQVVIMTPFTLAGAMAPVTIAGALAQQNAEALAGMTLTQLVRPGAPVVYGGFTSNVDMKSGSPAFGTPEFIKAAMVGGQLARRYGVPYRSSNVNAANAVDAQAGYEAAFSLWGAIMGGANIVFHGAGWLEGGLRASYEKLVLDADLLSMMQTLLEPIVVDDATLAVDAIAEVGPGGHFFGTLHTQDRYRTAFYQPMVSDWRNFESWEEAGSPAAHDKLPRLADEALQSYEAPVVSADVAEELERFVAVRVDEGGVETDF